MGTAGRGRRVVGGNNNINTHIEYTITVSSVNIIIYKTYTSQKFLLSLLHSLTLKLSIIHHLSIPSYHSLMSSCLHSHPLFCRLSSSLLLFFPPLKQRNPQTNKSMGLSYVYPFELSNLMLLSNLMFNL